MLQKAEGQNIQCFTCSELNKLLICIICKRTDLDVTFPKSAKKHKTDTTRNVRCVDCSHPVCSVHGCTTCKTCRRMECDDQVNCLREPEALNPTLLPKTMQQVLNFKCDRCAKNACICSLCGTRDVAAFSQSAKKTRLMRLEPLVASSAHAQPALRQSAELARVAETRAVGRRRTTWYVKRSLNHSTQCSFQKRWRKFSSLCAQVARKTRVTIAITEVSRL